MGQRISIDPVSRIGGNLRIDLDLDGGVVRNAWAGTTSWRGIEGVLRERPARESWLFAQRLCGSCTTAHAIASIRAVENAIGATVPINAQYLRNVLLSAHAVAENLTHFYQQSLVDWVDVRSAAGAEVGSAADLARQIGGGAAGYGGDLKAARTRLVAHLSKARGAVLNGRSAQASLAGPDLSLVLLAHYFDALEIARKAHQIVATLGGKTPHIQNLAVGGVANAINLDDPSALSMTRLRSVGDLIDEIRAFVDDVYLPDATALAARYGTWFSHGIGNGGLLALPEYPIDARGTRCDLPGGSLQTPTGPFLPITDLTDTRLAGNITLDARHSWRNQGRSPNPFDGDAGAVEPGERATTGAAERYSWSRTPLLDGRRVQVGPAAQVLVAINAAHAPTSSRVDATLARIAELGGPRLSAPALVSTMGRHLARAIRTSVVAETARRHWDLLMANIGRGDTLAFAGSPIPAGELRGIGLHESPQGCTAHFVVIEDGNVANYTALAAGAWNVGPRDTAGNPSPCESALAGARVDDLDEPIEALRIVRSFAPCMTCAAA